MSKPRIVLVDTNGDLLLAIRGRLERHGCEVRMVIVYPQDSCAEVVAWVLGLKPTIIVIEETLTQSFRGHDVVRSVGGLFYDPVTKLGNPRVISISTSPSEEMRQVSGELFKFKDLLVNKDPLLKGIGENHFVELVEKSVRRIA